jgi:hypothetical protein
MAATSAVAGYRPEKMIIRLGSDFPILTENGQPVEFPTANAFSVFLHEYFHYVHNISTAVGLAGFINTLEIWRLFRTTICETGFSAGHSQLDASYHEHYEDIYRLFHGIRTVHKPKLKNIITATSIEVSTAEFLTVAAGGRTDSTLSSISCLAKVGDVRGSTECHTIEVGVQEIMEAAAWLLERRYVNNSSPDEPEIPTAVFPYQVVPALVNYKLERADHDTILACVLAALHSTNPPEALMSILEVAKKAEDQKGSVFGAVKEAVRKAVSSNEIEIIRELDQIEKEFCDENIMAVGMRTITSYARTALQLRKCEPLFEIAFVDLLSKKEVSIDDIMNKVPACNVIQENFGPTDKPQRDLLVSFRPRSEGNADPEVGLRIIHVIFEFVVRHFSKDGFLTTDQLSARQCPFYTTCDLRLRQNCSAICKETPWKSADWDGWGDNGKCDYAAAISIIRPPVGN